MEYGPKCGRAEALLYLCGIDSGLAATANTHERVHLTIGGFYVPLLDVGRYAKLGR